MRHESSRPDLSPGVVGPDGRLAGAGERPAPVTVTLGGEPLSVVGTARIYVCGITPYDVTHLGHASTFVWADALAAVFGSVGIGTVTARNITDVDDVLTRAAERGGRRYDEFALNQEFLFGRDMSSLRVKRPDIEPRARHHIQAGQQLAQALLASDSAYERDAYVFFRGRDAVEAYAASSGRSLDELTRLSEEYGDNPADPLKDDPFDVPVWRPSGEGDPAWPSPWGWGRPGWHAECAAMALTVLGSSVDVLAGGADLTYPHHVYQQAMAVAASRVADRPASYARRLMHVGEVRLDGEKMAKSTGNLVLVHDLLEEHDAAAVRLLVLDRRWHEPWSFTPDALAAAESRLERVYSAAGGPGSAYGPDQVAAALVDDLDVPTALDLAEELGGPAARLALTALRLA